MLNKRRSSRGHTQVARQKALKNIIVQLAAVILIAILISFKSIIWGYSALLGGLIYLVPYLYVTNRVLTNKERDTHKNTANHTLAELYIGQIWKMVIGALLFALVFVLVKPLSPFSLFGTYIAVQAIGWWLQMRAEK